VQDAGLRVVELEEAREQERPHLGNRGPHRMPVLAEDIPARHGAPGECVVLHLQLCEALLDLGRGAAGLADAGEIAFHVREEHGHTLRAEILGQDLQRDRLARPGRAGDQPVAIGHLGQEMKVDLGLAHEDG
jgi:hypothetical protein